jgi:hypothetical protein
MIAKSVLGNLYYTDSFKCYCGEVYHFRAPVRWAMNNLEAFNEILLEQDRVERYHWGCKVVHEVNQFLKQPVIVSIQ